MSASAVSTLLLRRAGPMQSWGTQSRFTTRDSGREPSKSGVVGLLCAALGRPRTEPVDNLARLRMGVRVDREGILRDDYHTAGGAHRRGDRYGVAKADASRPTTVVSRRYFLADASFLVGLEGEPGLLRDLHQALAAPTWQLCLGRKAFVPGQSVWLPDGLCDGERLLAALQRYPWTVERPDRDEHGRRRFVLEADPATGPEMRLDQPVGAAFQDRRFAARYLRTLFLTPDDPLSPDDLSPPLEA